jgi:hypothetical protein
MLRDESMIPSTVLLVLPPLLGYIQSTRGVQAKYPNGGNALQYSLNTAEYSGNENIDYANQSSA